ncbi:MAG: hypothetical protein JNL21_01670 [Myxococcales bacterium]|nr:hypothetical protein [Myxococcales bacterium]
MSRVIGIAGGLGACALILGLGSAAALAQVPGDDEGTGGGTTNVPLSTASSTASTSSGATSTAGTTSGPTGGSVGPCLKQEHVTPDVCEAFCGEHFICLSAEDGAPVCGTLPESVDAGDQWTIRVLGYETCGPVVSLATTTKMSNDVKFAGQKKGLAADVRVLKELALTVSDDERAEAVRISFDRRATANSDAITASSVHSVDIDHGRYFWSAAVLVPFVFAGERDVIQGMIPGSSGRQIAVSEDLLVTAALMAHVYPCGRRRGLISTFQRSGSALAVFCDLFGLQAGLDLDFSDPTDQFYFGALLEPVSGFSLSGGAAVLKGEFLPNGFSEGMLSPKNLEVREEYMVRGYFGVSLSIDIIETIAATGRAVRQINFTQ